MHTHRTVDGISPLHWTDADILLAHVRYTLGSGESDLGWIRPLFVLLFTVCTGPISL